MSAECTTRWTSHSATNRSAGLRPTGKNTIMHVPDLLNRYTSLPVLLDALLARRLTLRTPESWEDGNDAHYLSRYKEEKKLRVLLAICFTTSRERFHHWKCFADGSSGVCIECRKAKLMKAIANQPAFRRGQVKYRYVDTVKDNPPDVDEWPFLKRMPFRDEREFRVIYKSKNAADKTNSFPFSLAAIRRVTLSPWLAKPVANNVIRVIKALPGCAHLKVLKSSLLQNAKWRKAIGLTGRKVGPSTSNTRRR